MTEKAEYDPQYSRLILWSGSHRMTRSGYLCHTVEVSSEYGDNLSDTTLGETVFNSIKQHRSFNNGGMESRTA